MSFNVKVTSFIVWQLRQLKIEWNWHDSVNRNSSSKDCDSFKRKKKEISIQKSSLNSKIGFWKWDLIRRKVKHHNTTLKNKNRKESHQYTKDRHKHSRIYTENEINILICLYKGRTQHAHVHTENKISILIHQPGVLFLAAMCAMWKKTQKTNLSAISSRGILIWSKENATWVYENLMFFLYCLSFLKIMINGQH